MTSKTLALQGLRGACAIIVFHRHLLMTFWIFPGYGYGVDLTMELKRENSSFHQLPFLRIIYSGGAMVEIFFFISGYTQSLQLAQYIQVRKVGEASVQIGVGCLSSCSATLSAYIHHCNPHLYWRLARPLRMGSEVAAVLVQFFPPPH